MVRRDSSQMPHLPSSCKMLITCFHFQTTFTFLKKQGFLLKECFVAPFQMIVAETIQTVGPNKRLRNFPLEEKVTCEARTFPCPNPSHLLGVGKRAGRILQDCYFLCETGRVPTQMALVFSPCTGGDGRSCGVWAGLLRLLCSLCLPCSRGSGNTD